MLRGDSRTFDQIEVGDTGHRAQLEHLEYGWLVADALQRPLDADIADGLEAARLYGVAAGISTEMQQSLGREAFAALVRSYNTSHGVYET